MFGGNNFYRHSLETVTVQCNIGYGDYEGLFLYFHLPFLGRFLPRLGPPCICMCGPFFGLSLRWFDFPDIGDMQ